MDKQITIKTKPERILEQFKDVFNAGGSINLSMGNGDFLYATGAQPDTILCKLDDGVHYSYQRDRKEWVNVNA